jgi:shikimate kinase
MTRRSIVLIGFMGAGKSAVGRAIADATGAELIDTDALVEAAAGAPVAEIFAREGERGFRAREADAVAEAASKPGRVIACGGGAILALRNYQVLREAGDIVYLRASRDALRARLAEDDATTRPLLADSQAFDRLLAERTPAYEAAADVIVDTDGRELEQIAADVIARLGVSA